MEVAWMRGLKGNDKALRKEPKSELFRRTTVEEEEEADEAEEAEEVDDTFKLDRLLPVPVPPLFAFVEMVELKAEEISWPLVPKTLIRRRDKPANFARVRFNPRNSSRHAAT